MADIFRKASLASTLGKRIIKRDTTILEFATAPWGPQIELTPVQRFSVKLIYKLPLDGVTADIKVYDKFKENVLHTFTEKEYRAYLYSEGRLNLSTDEEHMNPFINTFLRVWGRRAGKSEITALDLAYGIYTLLQKHDPHEYFRMPPDTQIFIPVLGTSQDSSKKTFHKVRNMLANSGYFSNFVNKDDLQEIFCKIYTPAQRDRDARFPSIIVQAFPLSATQVRGPASFRIVGDEIAHWPHSGAVSDVEVIKAVKPSMTTFKPSEDAPTEAMLFLISNASVRSGLFYETFERGIREGATATNSIVFQAPSFEVNPERIAAEELRDHFNTFGDVSYRTEFLSDFVDATSQWLTTDELESMFDHERPNRVHSTSTPYIYFPKAKPPLYFWGFDLGLKNDAAGLAISHWEDSTLTGERKLVFDLVERRMAGRHPYEALSELSGDDIVAWLAELAKIYPIADGVYDQWSGYLFGQMLAKQGISGLRMVSFSRPLNSAIYFALRSLTLNHQLSIPALNNEELIQEFQLLQAEVLQGNMIKVEAPPGKQYHDDMADAVARSCWCGLESFNTKSGVKIIQAASVRGTYSGAPSLVSQSGLAQLRQSAMSGDARAGARLQKARGRGR